MMYFKNLLLVIVVILFIFIFAVLPKLLADESAWWLLMYLVWPFVIAEIITIEEKEGDK